MDYTTRKALSDKVICAPNLPPKPTEAIYLTLNEHHRKLWVSMGDISDWLVNADVSGFATPTVGEWLHRCARLGR